MEIEERGRGEEDTALPAPWPPPARGAAAARRPAWTCVTMGGRELHGRAAAVVVVPGRRAWDSRELRGARGPTVAPPPRHAMPQPPRQATSPPRRPGRELLLPGLEMAAGDPLAPRTPPCRTSTSPRCGGGRVGKAARLRRRARLRPRERVPSSSSRRPCALLQAHSAPGRRGLRPNEQERRGAGASAASSRPSLASSAAAAPMAGAGREQGEGGGARPWRGGAPAGRLGKERDGEWGREGEGRRRRVPAGRRREEGGGGRRRWPGEEGRGGGGREEGGREIEREGGGEGVEKKKKL
ncbi:hypothetical protein PVAP13_6NG039198 [Panicum virgatum]|uniref:Uncharacterized protein n=1 Tax=Panicum virgatum TaxID=38727 RepID=A0A8T0QT81_PANVG|nr:hypothetical protein PVAP13_6NG039198 [Panicum virgatum]